MLGPVRWVRFAGPGLWGEVCQVGFARSTFLWQICWVRFAGLEFTVFGVLGGGGTMWGFPGFVGWDLLG